MRVHLIGVSGTGMGALAILLKETGHDVSGSDVTFAPPMGPALEAAGVRCLTGWSTAHLGPDAAGRGIDLVIVGNVARADNVEAKEAERLGLRRTSMSGALRDHFLRGRRPLVVTGTHGKTTTSAMAAVVLRAAGLMPGWFVGGLPKDLPAPASPGRRGLSLVPPSGLLPGHQAPASAPFVIEGDEYDAVYWDKKAKFFDYVALEPRRTEAAPRRPPSEVVILTSVEHDHIDIYPDRAAYEDAFRRMLRSLPEDALCVADAHDAGARALSREARCPVVHYAIDGDDTGDVTPTWLAVMAPASAGPSATRFDLFVGGMACGSFTLEVPGRHNVRNALATLAACAEGFGVPVATARTALATFHGVRRRQDLLGTPGGVLVYDDFAHHPTAVAETLQALKAQHGTGVSGRALWAVFEPRSATACRSLHQAEYVPAFGAADHVILAPLGRANIPEAERLDVAQIARDLGARATAAPDVAAIVERLASALRPGDVVALLSNGTFGGLAQALTERLERSAS